MMYSKHAGTEGPPPGTFGIVVLLDEAYASAPGGRQDLVIAAGSPELQVCSAEYTMVQGMGG